MNKQRPSCLCGICSKHSMHGCVILGGEGYCAPDESPLDLGDNHTVSSVIVMHRVPETSPTTHHPLRVVVGSRDKKMSVQTRPFFADDADSPPPHAHKATEKKERKIERKKRILLASPSRTTVEETIKCPGELMLPPCTLTAAGRFAIPPAIYLVTSHSGRKNCCRPHL